jgi:hypothetical protein
VGGGGGAAEPGSRNGEGATRGAAGSAVFCGGTAAIDEGGAEGTTGAAAIASTNGPSPLSQSRGSSVKPDACQPRSHNRAARDRSTEEGSCMTRDDGNVDGAVVAE